MINNSETLIYVKNNYIKKLRKLGIEEICGQMLVRCDIYDLGRALAIQRAVNH